MKLKSFKKLKSSKLKTKGGFKSFGGLKKKKKKGSSFTDALPSVPSHLKKKKKKHRSEKVSSDPGLDWGTTDTNELKGQLAAQRRQSGANRPPELYLKDGETKKIRFRDDRFIISFEQYSVNTDGKWQSYTAPRLGKKDLFRRKGLRPGRKVLYEVIDINGYRNNEGKRVRNIPRFLKASGKLHEMIEILAKKYGGLTNRVFELRRTGQSTQTQYFLVAEDPSKPSPEELRPERLKTKVGVYYAPPSLEEQRTIVRNVKKVDKDRTPF